jgi:hypothetical protein
LKRYTVLQQVVDILPEQEQVQASARRAHFDSTARPVSAPIIQLERQKYDISYNRKKE